MEDSSVEISISELRQIVLTVLDRLDLSAGECVTFDKDYFWSVPADGLFEMFNGPPELTVGQLSESIGHIRDALDDDSRVVGYHLVWVADILKAIGSKSSF